MTDYRDQIYKMVDRFLSWPLPRTFSPDCGISFDGRKPDEFNHIKPWPVGTSLLTANEARQMIEHLMGYQDENARLNFTPEQLREWVDAIEDSGIFDQRFLGQIRDHADLIERYAKLKWHAECMCKGIQAGYESATEHADDFRADFPEEK